MMQNQSSEWIENFTIVHESVVLTFDKEDSEIARSWSMSLRAEKGPPDRMNLKRLREEHAQLVTIAGRLTKVIARAGPPPSSQLSALRQELISAVIRHLKAEDWILYPRLFASPDSKVAQTAHAFSDEMGGLAKAFTGYAQRWGSYAIQIDWPGYRRETTAIIDALIQRITRENRDLYPLLEAAEAA
jgi:hypothetical protein